MLFEGRSVRRFRSRVGGMRLLRLNRGILGAILMFLDLYRLAVGRMVGLRCIVVGGCIRRSRRGVRATQI